MCYVMQQYVFVLGFAFSVCTLNHEFRSQIAMRTMVAWHDEEKNSFTITFDSHRNALNHEFT